MISWNKIPKRRSKRWPKKITLNVKEETWRKWEELQDTEADMPDHVRPDFERNVDEAYEAYLNSGQTKKPTG